MASAAEVLKPKTRAVPMRTGLADADRKKIADGLSEILASTYRLLIKTHIYHWNVVGPLFHSIHVLTEEQYNALFEATDIIAERIRALGHPAPVLSDRKLDTSIELKASGRSAHDMVADLVRDHEEAVRRMREVAQHADEKGDLVTSDMLTDRLTFHEKALWMLRATISE